jgi:hypothetical protein
MNTKHCVILQNLSTGKRQKKLHSQISFIKATIVQFQTHLFHLILRKSIG